MGRVRSRSRSRSPRRAEYSRLPRERDNGRHKERSRSPYHSRRGGRSSPPPPVRGRVNDGREKPEPCPCLGVFGMSLHTNERDLKKIFNEYGEVESVQIVYDRYTGRSRGFGFVYFTSTRDATRAKEHLLDCVIDGMKVRVDYSITRGGGPYRHQRSRSASLRRTSRRSRS